MRFPKIFVLTCLDTKGDFRILQVVATGAYYPPVATTGAYFAQNGEKLIFL